MALLTILITIALIAINWSKITIWAFEEDDPYSMSLEDLDIICSELMKSNDYERIIKYYKPFLENESYLYEKGGADKETIDMTIDYMWTEYLFSYIILNDETSFKNEFKNHFSNYKTETQKYDIFANMFETMFHNDQIKISVVLNALEECKCESIPAEEIDRIEKFISIIKKMSV